jgi:hypothetical protein
LTTFSPVTAQLAGWLLEAQKRQLNVCVEQGQQKAQRQREAMQRIGNSLEQMGHEIPKSHLTRSIPPFNLRR